MAALAPTPRFLKFLPSEGGAFCRSGFVGAGRRERVRDAREVRANARSGGDCAGRLAGWNARGAGSRPVESGAHRSPAVSVYAGEHRGIGTHHGPLPGPSEGHGGAFSTIARSGGLVEDGALAASGSDPGRGGRGRSRWAHGRAIWGEDLRASIALQSKGRVALFRRDHQRARA